VKRPLRPEELRVWAMVAGTVRPLPGRDLPAPPPADPLDPPVRAAPRPPASTQPRPPKPVARDAEKAIEPNRRHRIIREREPIGGRIDLHGLDQDRARAALEDFLRRSWAEGYRAVLVITGKGLQGDGVLRRRAPEWLADPRLADVVAGISEAHRRHGGAGALYVALKRRPRT